MSELRAIVHASRLYTGEGIRQADGVRPSDDQMGIVSDGALVYSLKKKTGVPDQILFAGATQDLPKRLLSQLKSTGKKQKILSLDQKQAVIPGLVDCHNHLVFSGDRADEFARRCAGATYSQIASEGGGIQKTVRSTRQASLKELVDLGRQRIAELKRFGVRTLEIKSGYGLSHDSEIKILRAAKILAREHPELKICRTYLGAHDFPKDQSRQSYLREVIERTLPEVAKSGLADACDVFIDSGFYTSSEGEKILKKAQSLGLKIKVHADELKNTESATLAARLGALSADHLLQVSKAGIRALAKSETVAVLLPGTAFYLKSDQAPARELIQAGVRVALATDFNPGTCVTLNLPAVMTIAALQLGMSCSEIFAAVTYCGARALDVHSKRGTLETGMDAAFAVLSGNRFEDLYYQFARSGI